MQFGKTFCCLQYAIELESQRFYHRCLGISMNAKFFFSSTKQFSQLCICLQVFFSSSVFNSNVMVAVATKVADNPVSQIRSDTSFVSKITVTGCHGSRQIAHTRSCKDTPITINSWKIDISQVSIL